MHTEEPRVRLRAYSLVVVVVVIAALVADDGFVRAVDGAEEEAEEDGAHDPDAGLYASLQELRCNCSKL